MKPFQFRKRIAITVAAVSLAWMPLASRVQAGEIVIATNDGPRTAIVLPAGEGPHPTVIVLHGAMMTARMAARISGFAEPAARAGFTAVFPQGLMLRWHDGRTGGTRWTGRCRFLTDLNRPADRGTHRAARPYRTSRHLQWRHDELHHGLPGGRPVPRPWYGNSHYARQDRSHAIRRRCRSLWSTALTIRWSPTRAAKPDSLGAAGAVWSARRTAELFVRRNGCEVSNAQELPRRGLWEGTSVTEISWRRCNYHKPVTLYQVKGGGHQIAGRPFLPFLLGRSNRDISAAEAIMSAFAREDASEGEL